MDVVGLDEGCSEPSRVYTIDVWYSDRSRAWFVDRLDREGRPLGLSVRFLDELDVAECVAEWLRVHPETHLSTSSWQETDRYWKPLRPRHCAA